MLGAIEQLVEQVSLTYYDVVLAVIPAVFLVAVVAGTVLSIPPETAVAGASVVAALALIDALFVNPPIANG